MRIAVRYYSRGGSTEKAARAIAREAGERAETTDKPLDKRVDLLFIGSGIYKGHIDSHVKDFIESLSPDKVGKAVFFSTAMMGGGKSDEEVRKLLEKKGIPMTPGPFTVTDSSSSSIEAIRTGRTFWMRRSSPRKS